MDIKSHDPFISRRVVIDCSRPFQELFMQFCFKGLCFHRKVALIVTAAAIAGSIMIALVCVFIVSSAAADGTDERLGYSQVTRKKDIGVKRGEPVAVVELFTSEGCSSCPPADRNLQRLARLGMTTQRNLIPLSFHVDYWNDLGWTDPLSQSAFSDRQREYAAAMQTSNVYTPQMIVNGQVEFVGSSEKASDKAIERALKTPVKHLVDLTIPEVGAGQKLQLRYHVEAVNPATDADSDFVLNVAIVSEIETFDVPRGENEGKKLSHAWVVKSFEVLSLEKQDGVLEIDTKYIKPGHTRLVAYVQARESWEITGASTIPL
jgi:hypothetical protein